MITATYKDTIDDAQIKVTKNLDNDICIDMSAEGSTTSVYLSLKDAYQLATVLYILTKGEKDVSK